MQPIYSICNFKIKWIGMNDGFQTYRTGNSNYVIHTQKPGGNGFYITVYVNLEFQRRGHNISLWKRKKSRKNNKLLKEMNVYTRAIPYLCFICLKIKKFTGKKKRKLQRGGPRNWKKAKCVRNAWMRFEGNLKWKSFCDASCYGKCCSFVII